MQEEIQKENLTKGREGGHSKGRAQWWKRILPVERAEWTMWHCR